MITLFLYNFLNVFTMKIDKSQEVLEASLPNCTRQYFSEIIIEQISKRNNIEYISYP